MNMKRLGKIIKEARIKQNMRQEELGELVGLKKAAISRYENGSFKRIDTCMFERFFDDLHK